MKKIKKLQSKASSKKKITIFRGSRKQKNGKIEYAWRDYGIRGFPITIYV